MTTLYGNTPRADNAAVIPAAPATSEAPSRAALSAMKEERLLAEKDEYQPSSLAPKAPLFLSAFTQVAAYEKGEATETWKSWSDEECAVVAMALLEDIQAEGLELTEAGYLDISGNSWGCVFSGNDGDSFMITLMPESLFSPRSEDNRLELTIVHFLKVEKLA